MQLSLAQLHIAAKHLGLAALTIALTFACISPAHAAWTRIGKTESVTLYVNRDSVVTEGDVRRMWEMQDLAAPDADGVRSRRYLNEYDCKNKVYRVSQMTSFAGPKLTGAKLFEVAEPGYWRKIPPGGLFVLSYIALCVK